MPRLRLDDTRLDELPAPANGQIDYWDPALPGFGLRVSQGGTRAWVMMVRQAGRKRRITLGAYPGLSLGEARAKCHAFLAPPHAPASRNGRDHGTAGRGVGGARETVKLASGLVEGGPSLARFLERAPVPLLVVQGGLIRRASTAAAALLGAGAPAALLGRTLLDFVHPIERAAFIHRQAGSAAQASEKAPPLRLRLFRLDGSAFPATVTVASLSDPPAAALAIVITDLSKHERAAPYSRRKAAQQVEPAMRAGTEFMKTSHATRGRSLAKTVTWHFTASLDTFALASIITGQLEFGAFIAGAEVFTKMLLYYLHERVWAHLPWGLKTE